MLRVKFNLISTTGELHFVFCFRGCHQTGLCCFANSVLGTVKLYSDACEFFAWELLCNVFTCVTLICKLEVPRTQLIPSEHQYQLAFTTQKRHLEVCYSKRPHILQVRTWWPNKRAAKNGHLSPENINPKPCTILYRSYSDRSWDPERAQQSTKKRHEGMRQITKPYNQNWTVYS